MSRDLLETSGYEDEAFELVKELTVGLVRKAYKL